MTMKAPLERVTEEFGGKDKLVDKIVGLLDTDEPREDVRKRLLGAANSKLIRLHGIASAVRSKFGSHDKLVAATAAALGRTKDKDYVGKLEDYSSGRLLDMMRSVPKVAAPASPDAPKPAAKPAQAKPEAVAASKPAAVAAKGKAAPAKKSPEKTKTAAKAKGKPAAKGKGKKK